MSAIDKIKTELKKYPHIVYKEYEGREIDVDPVNKDGFNISFEESNNPTLYRVCFDTWHLHAESETEAINCFFWGLTSKVRLKVTSRGKIEFRWTVEKLEDGEWIKVDTMTIFTLYIFFFWLPLKEKYLQNHMIEDMEML
jgi:hypothetical protein